MKRFTAMIWMLVICLVFTGMVYAAPAGQEGSAASYQVTVYFTGNEGLALRTAPDEAADKYLTIPEGTGLWIDMVSSGWGHVSYNGYNGWVSLQYTKIAGDYTAPAPVSGYISPVYYTVYNTEGEGLELRTSATAKSSTFGPLYDGTVLKAEAQDGEWVYGEHNGHYGWCNTMFLRFSTAQEISQYEGGGAAGQSADVQIPSAQTANPGSMLALPEDNGYVQAYMTHLIENGSAIHEYDWQKLFYPAEDEDGLITRAVVLSNIYGDATPELIYIAGTGEENGGNFPQPRLTIVTYENGAVRTLFSDGWENAKYVGGYYDYYLFRMSGKDYLYFYRDRGDDGGTAEYGRFDVTVDGTLKITELFTDNYRNDGSVMMHEFLKQGTAISAENYEAQIQHAQSNTESILMISDGCGDFAESFVAQNGCPAMTLDEALSLLSSMQRVF